MAARTTRINHALAQLSELRDRLLSPRSRIRTEKKAAQVANEVLRQHDVENLIAITVEERVVESFRQATRGRPGKNTCYVKETRTHCSLDYDVDNEAIAREALCDGVFPLITNDESLSARHVLDAYKKQPLVEKRFSQLKTDFRVAPMYLKSPHRVEALLCVYFFVLMAEALLERELRQSMQRAEVASLPMYPEGRPCRRPTAPRLIDLFDSVERHTLQTSGQEPTVMITDLSRAQRKILRLLRLNATDYGR